MKITAATLPAQKESWLQAAMRLPLGFSQVREDALLDLKVAELAGSDADICIVASGGCTAAYLAARGAARSLCLVDPNPAQLNLSKLKLHLLQTSSPEARLSLLGHKQMNGEQRLSNLLVEAAKANVEIESIAPASLVAALGLDYCGRYERLFAQLQETLAPYGDEIVELLAHTAPCQQTLLTEATPLGRALDNAFAKTFALPNLVALFGTSATSNAAMPFARHFRQRLQIALQSMPAHNNPYLHQMLTGKYPQSELAPWLTLDRTKIGTEIELVHSDMLSVLQNKSKLDLIYLSNILDWLNPNEAQSTLKAAFDALRPGGHVFIRQLNSNLNISAYAGFHWSEQAEILHRTDRSFFYQHLHLGVKS